MQAQQPMRPANNMAFALDNRGPMIGESGLTNNRVPVNPRLGMISQNVQGPSSGNQIIRVDNDSDEEDGMNGGGRFQAPPRGGMMGGSIQMQQPNRNQNVKMMMMQAKK